MPWDNGEYRLADGGVDGAGAEGLGGGFGSGGVFGEYPDGQVCVAGGGGGFGGFSLSGF